MTTPDEITWSSWRDLETGAISYGRLNARRLGTGCVVLAVDHEGRRHVLLAVSSAAAGLSDSRSRGISVVTRELEIEDRPASPFIDVCCMEASNLEAFDTLATSLVREVESGVHARDAVRQTIARWRRFWSGLPTEGLSGDQLRGLFGELWFLLVWLLPHGTEVLNHWTGPRGLRADFQWPAFSIEVKTTASIRGHIHRINGLDQLDTSPGESLRLFSLRVREDLAAANSLVTLAAGIRQALAAQPEELDLFEGALAAAGYSPEHEERYAEQRFRIVSERLYRVEGTFPRLSADSFQGGVPQGIERVEYEVNLDGFQELIVARTPDEFALLQ